jgi:Calcineurin-like phosphoesterase
MRRGPDKVANALADAVQSLVSRHDTTTIGVLSGDLSVLGDVPDIGAVRSWWTTIASALPATALTRNGTATRRPVYILGNHDFWNGAVRATALKHSQVHMQARNAHWREHSVWSVVAGRLRVTMYELDTTPSRGVFGLARNVIAKGELDPSVRYSLPGFIAAEPVMPDEVVLRLAVMHHPVGELTAKLAAIDALNQTGINLVLSGHTHAFGNEEYGFIQAVSGSSTLRHDGAQPSFLLHSLVCGPDGTVSLRTTRWDFDGDHFQSGAVVIESVLV